MSARARELVVSEAVALLREYFDPRADETDVKLFGPNCCVSSALPQKYGIDKIEERIYNIGKESGSIGSGLFGEARLNGGYIEFKVSEEGMARLIALAGRGLPESEETADRFEVGCNAGYIHAALLHTANTAAGGFLLPRGFWAERALWFCLMADSDKQRSLALEAAYRAVDEHRRIGSFSREAAAAAAAAVFDWI